MELLERIDRPPHDHANHDHDSPRQRPGAVRNPLRRDVISNQPPLEDGNAWVAQRNAAAQNLREGQVTTAKAWAEAEGLTTTEVSDVAHLIDHLHTQMQTLKQEVEDGGRTPVDLRRDIVVLRVQTRADLTTLLGADRTELLRAELAGHQLGGGF